ncbi:MAG: 6-phosphogluconolactonase [Treponema sp.]|nr:6-phosphogluconolactonase [Treponema sp.]
MEIFKKDQLILKKFPSRRQMGETAAAEVSAVIKDLLKAKECIRMIFAAAPSQNEFHEALAADKTIDFSRIIAFQTDEFTGIPADAPQSCSNFLKKGLFGKCKFRETNCFNSLAADMEEECKRYSDLINRARVDIACIGIGENTHIAFNDPGVADFYDPKTVKLIPLDLITRYQQVNDGIFRHIDQVPATAITLTVPCLFNSTYIFCVVPLKNKEPAISLTLSADICEKYPATILRRHERAILYIDSDPGLRLGDVPGLTRI